MPAELREEGLIVGRHRVARLMRENGLKAHQKRRFKKTTDSHHDCPIAFNLLDQNFSCDGPGQKWGADISYIWTAEGWLYLAIVLDLYSRRIVGWATSDRLKKGLALKALSQAILMRQPPVGLIHHSDRGRQYCSDDYHRLLQLYGLTPSMSGKGNCAACPREGGYPIHTIPLAICAPYLMAWYFWSPLQGSEFRLTATTPLGKSG